ncbi:hypothetical protein Acor_72530 [Acrocarpospora corrugata]|uniref:Uncharacterized protein n=1 Tax=Acrocarpospora corrugata TaxID=35763 RepID=A0A5M3W7Z7_9ACTN|nr:hypothetical protein Acor_72530 [Acrocarpospora corrugata]
MQLVGVDPLDPPVGLARFLLGGDPGEHGVQLFVAGRRRVHQEQLLVGYLDPRTDGEFGQQRPGERDVELAGRDQRVPLSS